MKKNQKNHHYSSLLAGVLLIAALLMSMLVFAQAEQTEPTEDSIMIDLPENTDGRTKKPTATPKPTRTPKPTKTPKPTPTEYPFEPGLREDHEGHVIEYQILDSNDWQHTIKEYCRTCRMTIKAAYTEDHQLDADGCCSKCSYRCKHDSTLKYDVPADGAVKTWDGEWITYPGTEIEECNRCGKVLKSENTIIRRYHNTHTRFFLPKTWLPQDEKNHCADVECLDCNTTFTTTQYHDFNTDAPFEDDGDQDTHTHQVVCKDCGYSAERREAHHFVHDSYIKDETDTGHIEVFKCDVCGALKYEKQPHDAGRVISIWKIDDPEMHKRYLQCSLCKIFYWDFAPHELVHEYYKFDGNNDTHIDMYRCTVCGQMVEKRENHSPIHVTWKNVSDTQDQEIAFCKVCNHNYSLALSAHQFDSFAYHTNGLDKHTVYRTCSKCGTQEKNGKTYIEGHTFSDRTCTKCGQSSVHEEGHIPLRYTGKALLLDADHHVNEGICFLCLASFYDYDHIKTHKIDPLTMKCTACGFLQEGCEHHYGQIAYWTEKGHFFTGNCEKCGKQSTEQYFEYHNMQWESKIYGLQDSETSHHLMRVQKCTVCGYKQVMDFGSRDHRFVQVGNNQRCEKCGYLKKSSCEHTFEYTTDPKKQTETVHYCQLKCTKCGAESFKYEKHDLKPLPDSRYQKINNEIHSNAVRYRCIVCGYETSVKESE